MKKAISIILTLALLCTTLAGCGGASGASTAKSVQKEKITINASDFVYLSRSNEQEWIPTFDYDSLQSTLSPYLNASVSEQDLRKHIYSFSVDPVFIRVTSEPVVVPLHVNKNMLEGLKSIVNADFTWDKTVTIPMTPSGSKPQDTKKVNLMDYVILIPQGFNGEGTIKARFDCTRYAKDFASRAQEAMFSDDHRRFPSAQAYLNCCCAASYTCPFLRFSQKEGLKNGDKVEISCELISDTFYLGPLGLEAESQKIDYTVQGLRDFTPVDPFENLTVCTHGIQDKTYWSMESAILTDTGWISIYPVTELDTSTPIHEGDTIHVSLHEYLPREYGEEFFSRMEADVQAAMPVLPNTENAHQLLSSLSYYSLGNAEAMGRVFARSNPTVSDCELVGMMLYYNDANHLVDDHLNPSNQLIFIDKYISDAIPQGWYSFASYNTTMMLYNRFDTTKGIMTIQALDEVGQEVGTNLTIYRSEDGFPENYPASFTENGVEHIGHRTLSEVFQAIDANLRQDTQYDHLAVSDSLKGQVSEF